MGSPAPSDGTITITHVPTPPPIANPLKPDSKSFPSQSFHTLTREAAFSYPPTDRSDVPALDELVAPHIESFNALMEDGENGGKGLLALAVQDIGAKVVFDGKKPGTGNKLSSKSPSMAAVCRSPSCVEAGRGASSPEQLDNFGAPPSAPLLAYGPVGALCVAVGC
jgi:hypothetical protein